jgi:two-component system NarL family sensor kinase
LLGAPLLGALIVAHQPRNHYGWVWCAIGLTSGVSAVTAAYAVYALLVAPNGLPGGLGAAWLSTSTSYLTYGLLPFMLLLFPDGHLPSPRWRPVGWAAGLAAVGLVLEATLKAGPLESFPFWDNPFGVALSQKVLDTLDNVSWLIFYSSLVIMGPAALITRFVRARGQQRQQLKWIAIAGGLVLADPIVTGIVQDQRPVVVAIVDALVFWGIYTAIGIAVLRYRLYDIDRLLNRTLVYGLLWTSPLRQDISNERMSSWERNLDRRPNGPVEGSPRSSRVMRSSWSAPAADRSLRSPGSSASTTPHWATGSARTASTAASARD